MNFEFYKGRFLKYLRGNSAVFVERQNGTLYPDLNNQNFTAILSATASGGGISSAQANAQAGTYNQPQSVTATGSAGLSVQHPNYLYMAVALTKWKFYKGKFRRVLSGNQESFAVKSDGQLFQSLDVRPLNPMVVSASGSASSKVELQEPGLFLFTGTAYQANANSTFTTAGSASESGDQYTGSLYPLTIEDGKLFNHLDNGTWNVVREGGKLYQVKFSHHQIHSCTANASAHFSIELLPTGLGVFYNNFLSCTGTGLSRFFADPISSMVSTYITPKLQYRDGLLFRHNAGHNYYRSNIVYRQGLRYKIFHLCKDYPVNVVEVGASTASVSSATVSATVVTPPQLELTASGQAVSAVVVQVNTIVLTTASGQSISSTFASGGMPHTELIYASGQALTSGSAICYRTLNAQAIYNNKAILYRSGGRLCRWFKTTSTTGRAYSYKYTARLIFGYEAAGYTSGYSHTYKVSAICGKKYEGTASGKAWARKNWCETTQIIVVTASGQAVSRMFNQTLVSAEGSATSSVTGEIQKVWNDSCNASGQSLSDGGSVGWIKVPDYVTTASGSGTSYLLTKTLSLVHKAEAVVGNRSTSKASSCILTYCRQLRAGGSSITSGVASPYQAVVVEIEAVGASRFRADATNYDTEPWDYTDYGFRRLQWNPVYNAQSYSIYRSDSPGSNYYFVDSVGQTLQPEYRVAVDMSPQNLVLSKAQVGVNLGWEEAPILGAPMTFKVVPIGPGGVPFFTPESDSEWMGDVLPAGASWIDQIGLTQDSFHRHGDSSLKVTASYGYVEPRFSGASDTIPNGYIIVWVYIPEGEEPDSLWFSFYNGEDWEHRGFWSRNDCPFGQIGDPSKMYVEEIPAPNLWTPLIINCNLINLGNVSGMGIGVYKEHGNATVYVDGVCHTNQPVYKVNFPHIGLCSQGRYVIKRDGNIITYCDTVSYNDQDAANIYGFSNGGRAPTYFFDRNEVENKIVITWGIPQEIEVTYNYEVAGVDTLGKKTNFTSGTIDMMESYDRTEITISSPQTPVFTVSVSDCIYEQTDVIAGETYHYTFVTYDSQNNVIATVVRDYTVPYGSVLGYFKLGKSVLA